MPKVIVQQWREYERGWGSRPDGYTVHKTREDHRKFVQEYVKKNNSLPDVPDEYTTIDGEPYEMEAGPKTLENLETAPSYWGVGNRVPEVLL